MATNDLDFLPRVLPVGWREIRTTVPSARTFLFELGARRSVIVAVEMHPPGRKWIHLSIASPDRLPSWEALKEAKELFLGDRDVIQWLPRKSEYVNAHPNCLHLWAPFDGAWPAEFGVAVRGDVAA